MAVDATRILCGSLLAALTSRMPSAPEAPDLFWITMGVFTRPCLVMMAWITRAIWSEAPPGENGTTISTALVGVQLAWAPEARAKKARVELARAQTVFRACMAGLPWWVWDGARQAADESRPCVNLKGLRSFAFKRQIEILDFPE
ncbi:hypothetical protein D3C78_1520060 [compost metagenome]